MKNRTTAGILALFLGGLGLHKFYLNNPLWGVVYLVFCWTFIPALVALIEAIMIFSSNDKSFNEKYNHGFEATYTGGIKATPETHIKCPDCRELILKDARKCRHCSASLIPQ